VLRSADGIHWRRDTSVDLTGARAFDAATVLPVGALLAVASTGTTGPKPRDVRGTPGWSVNTACAAAWIEYGGAWSREDIGCHGVPEALLLRPDGRVLAARGSYLFVRPAAAPSNG
jgi:hypothetical protein